MTQDGAGRAGRRNRGDRNARRDRRDGERPGGEPNRRGEGPGRRQRDGRQGGANPAATPSVRLARSAAMESLAEFHPDTMAADGAVGSTVHRRVILTLVALLACALAWAYFGRLASYMSAVGKVQTTGRTKVLEARTKGTVLKINVVDGDVVKPNAVLVELDPADAQAARAIIDQKLVSLRAETLRLKTEIKAVRATTIDPKVAIPWGKDVPAIVRTREEGVAQRQAKEAERDKYAANIRAQKALVAITQENLTMIETLLKNGYNSQANYLDMKAQLDDQRVTQTGYEGSLENAAQAILMIDSEIAKTTESFVSRTTQTVSTNEQTLLDLAQQLVKADQVLAGMKLRAPVAGVIHASAVTTIGQVVKPGQQLMQIVPNNAPLEILAYASNSDIGFLHVGDPATIKVTAFAFKTYGSIDGTVTDIANDSLALQGKASVQSSSLDGEYVATSDAQKTGNLQFPIIVRAARSTIRVEGKDVPLVPGMTVDVEVLTENRRAIDYIVSPIKELFSTAAHER
jgi:hemolysin D